MIEIIFMSGVPGSGKTWLRNKLISSLNVDVVSSDDYIEEFATSQGKTYREVFAEVYPQAESKKFADIEDHIKNGKSFILDCTHLTRKSRASMMNRCKQIASKYKQACRFSIYAIKLDTARISESQEQRKLVGRDIPAEVMASMIRSFTLPTADEGFVDIYICENTENNFSLEHIFGSETY